MDKARAMTVAAVAGGLTVAAVTAVNLAAKQDPALSVAQHTTRMAPKAAAQLALHRRTLHSRSKVIVERQSSPAWK
jgi:hypothetical protein